MVVIRCKNICKSFNGVKVIKDFTYEFLDNTLYSIYGESGSGKTTLLNIITGNICFKGDVEIFQYAYQNKVNKQIAKENIAYITQDNFFIDYLTIYDNLKLCCNKETENMIFKLLNKYGLKDKCNNYPSELSGGELQRMSIIMAILQGKKILIFDEPTASLDEENATFLIQMLISLKKDHLIICATHDKALINKSDYKIEIASECNKVITNEACKIKEPNPKRKSHLLKYMLKEHFNKKSEKKSSIILMIIFSNVFLVFNLCFDYEKKIELSMLKIHNINFVDYYCYKDDDPFCDSTIREYNGVANVFIYNANLPLTNNDYSFESTAKTLPFDNKLLPNYQSYLAYGHYYENENDIILGYELANNISSNIESLIGESYEMQLPDGLEKFRIVGILKDIEDDIYMRAMNGNHSINREAYLNDKYVLKYKNNNVPKYNKAEQGFYIMRAYFGNTKDLQKFYEENQYKLENWMNGKPKGGIIVEKRESNFIEFKWLIMAISYYIKPGIFFAFFVAIIFYYETLKIKNKYKGYTLSIYNYYGYSWWNIILNNILSSIIFLTELFFVALIFIILLTPILNYLLINFNITEFNLFLIDYQSAMFLYIYLISFASFLLLFLSLSQIKNGWLNTVKEGDNFL